MKLKNDSTIEKLRGAYYTPLQLARIIVDKLPNRKYARILEPSCGDGVFLDCIQDINYERVVAIEIEPKEAKKAKEKKIPRSSITCEDFLSYYDKHDSEKFDLIIGNPPYIRYQYLTPEQRDLQNNILIKHGMKSNKLINAWVCFLVACVQMLTDNGTIAFVLPAELLQVVYAEDLRLYLSEHLSKMTVIAFKSLVFPDIEQEIVVFVGEKSGEKRGIRIIEVADIEEYANTQLDRFAFQPLLHTKDKWTKYFVSAEEADLIDTIRNDDRFAPFSDFGIINVGITTGNNKFFSIDSVTEAKYALESVTLPLIGRSSHAHGIYFTKNDWKRNIAEGKNAMLINFPDVPYDIYPEKHRAYIEYGESASENDGYKCSIRDRWYIVPSVWVPDAFFLRRNNLYPKFVINKCGAVSTDTMHRMKLNKGVNADNLLLGYYNSISFAFAEICGRSYGGGVLEILPKEMGNILIPRIERIDPTLRKSLLKRIDNIVRRDLDIEEALDIVDKEVLINELGIDPDWCTKMRKVWHRLQQRRLSRSE